MFDLPPGKARRNIIHSEGLLTKSKETAVETLDRRVKVKHIKGLMDP